MVDAVFRPCAPPPSVTTARRSRASKSSKQVRADSALRLRYTACSVGGGPALATFCPGLRLLVQLRTQVGLRQTSHGGGKRDRVHGAEPISFALAARAAAIVEMDGVLCTIKMGSGPPLDRLEDRGRNGCSKPMPQLASVNKHLFRISRTTSDNRHCGRFVGSATRDCSACRSACCALLSH